MSRISKVLFTRPGNAITRQYRNAKINRNMLGATALFDFSIAAMDAMDKNASGTVIMGLLTCFLMKLSKDCHYNMLKLKPQYNEILTRANKIFASKK